VGKKMSEIGIIGLGRMGANIARRLARRGHTVVVYNRTTEKAYELAGQESGVKAVGTLGDMAKSLNPPRAVWVMVPAGQATEDMIDDLLAVLSKGDLIIDGGNSHYSDSLRTADKVRAKGIDFIDVGTSGGIWGLTEGYSLMVGGDKQVVDRMSPIFSTLAPAPDKGWGHVGPVGSGHYVKMVHNGVEYGMMQSFAEGFEILKAKEDFNLDLHQVAEVWRYGSVVRAWLLDLIADVLSKDPTLSDVKGWVADSGEGRWTVEEAINENVPSPVITLSLIRRIESRQTESYQAKLLAAMRNEFGGHEVKHE
jgi:6-phosphogluconate dehydrogenase